MFKIKEVVLIGGGPVGSYVAVLTSLFGLPTTVYEKRESYTRKINVKIEHKLFNETDQIIKKLGIQDDFFKNLNQIIENQNRRIIICDLEALLKNKAASLGAKYKTEEIKSFESVYQKHSSNHPIILDCTGRKSMIRNAAFGDEDFNMEVIPLESALHINFKAAFDKLDKSLLYSSMKNNENIKLSEIVSGKNNTEDGYKNVTIPIFISENLAKIFDLDYPNINRMPLMPFKVFDKEIPMEIFKTISSIIGPLMMEDWKIDFKSIQIKKIEITCGYSKLRSKTRFVCLGDSAVHLAYFKSLNFGLKHALDFFVTLSNYILITKETKLLYDDTYILDEFERLHFRLNPICVKRTISANTCLIITKILFNGVYKFCLTTNETEQLTSNFGVKESSIEDYVKQVNENLSNWDYLLYEFEKKRSRDIQNVIESNCRKKQMFDYVSDFIWLNGKSPIKISELLSKLFYGYALFKEDHEFFNKCLLKVREYSIVNESDQKLEKSFEIAIKNLLDLYSFGFTTRNIQFKKDFLSALRNLFDINDDVKKISSVREMVEVSLTDKMLHDGDVKFMFLIKCVNVIIESTK